MKRTKIAILLIAIITLVALFAGCDSCKDGHTEEILSAKEATCTETGLTEGKKCSVCGQITVAQEEIPAKGHTEEVIPAKEATCTEDGLTEGKKCSVCGMVITAQETVPAAGHTEVIDAGKEAQAYADGLTEGKHCSVCGTVIVAQEVIPALGGNAGKEFNIPENVKYDIVMDGESVTVYKIGNNYFEVQNGEVFGIVEGKDGEKYMITYSPVIDISIRSYEPVSQDIVDSYLDSMLLLTTREMALTAEPDHSKDKEVDGVHCTAYCIEDEGMSYVIYLGSETGMVMSGATVVDGNEVTVLEISNYDTSVDSYESLVPKCLVTGDDEDHVYGDWVETQKQTCFWNGYKNRTCEKCGHVETVMTPADPALHEIDDTWTTDWDNTKHFHYCKSCGVHFDEAEHDIVIDEGIPATTTQAGLSDGSHCAVCGAVIKTREIIPALETEDDDKEDEEGYYLKIESEEDSFEIINIKNIFCCRTEGETMGLILKEDGYRMFLWSGNEKSGAIINSIMDEDNAKEFKDGMLFSEVVALIAGGERADEYDKTIAGKTCEAYVVEEDGKTGIVYIEPETNLFFGLSEIVNGEAVVVYCVSEYEDGVDSLDRFEIPECFFSGEHEFGEWEVTQEQDCFWNGYKNRTCEKCGYTEEEVTPADPELHVPSEEMMYDDDKHYYYCTTCGIHIDEEEHKFGEPYDESEATCACEGSYWITCEVCGYNDYVIEEKSDVHTYTYGFCSYEAPTEEEEGYITFECDCSDSTEVKFVLPALSEENYEKRTEDYLIYYVMDGTDLVNEIRDRCPGISDADIADALYYASDLITEDGLYAWTAFNF